MKPAQYAVIRFMPDLARQEVLNIGIVIWDDETFRVRVDSDAAVRVVRASPWLAEDALLFYEAYLSEQIESQEDFDPGAIPWILQDQPAFPSQITEPRYTTIDSDAGEDIDDTLERLLARIVKPRQHRGGRSKGNPKEQLASQLKPLLDQKRVVQGHSFRGRRTGMPRSVDFFANSGANIAIDVLQLDVQQANTIIDRVDAQAYKLLDWDRDETIKQFVVYCHLSNEEQFVELNHRVVGTLEHEHATVFTSPEPVAQLVARVARR